MKAAFVPLDLSGNAAPLPATAAWHSMIDQALGSLPQGRTELWGVPFELPHPGSQGYVLLPSEPGPPIAFATGERQVTHLLAAHFTLPRPDTVDPIDPEHRPLGMPTGTGQIVATYSLVYADGGSHARSIRRRFEINDVLVGWGQLAFAARPHRAIRPLAWRGPHRPGEWGYDQTAAELPDYDGIAVDGTDRVFGSYWLCAIENPTPERPVTAIRLEGAGSDVVAIGGLTLATADGNPLRHDRLRTFRVTDGAGNAASLDAGIDLGVIASRTPGRTFDASTWLAASPGQGDPVRPLDDSRAYLDVVGSPAATLRVGDTEVPLGSSVEGATGTRGGSVTVEVLDQPRTVVEARIVDAATGRPTPARVHVRTLDGRYLPPYGHRREVNDAWFEDYGADLLLGDTAYAYVDGSFRIELPVGDVLLDVAKGFEYAPVRTRMTIAPAQSHLEIPIVRTSDRRAAGWVSADTHVHFVSPEAAWLMGQAEGINLVNLLAAQWGDLFTNIADVTGDLSGVSRGETLVWVGTENRQHILGHLSLLGGRGPMAAPLSAAGPNESYLGDPVWSGMSGWADTCHAAGGVTVIPHFPNPDGEVAAECLLGKVDGVELRDFWHGIDTHAVRTWYRYLDAGMRVPAVGGTDKMSAGMPIGGVRTDAFIGDADLTLDSWATALRQGRTVTSSGPILELSLEGHGIGDEIRLPAGGGHLEARVTATCLQGIGSIELIQDGRVVAREEAPPGARTLTLGAVIDVTSAGWIAARCTGPATAWHCWPVRMAAHTSPIYLAVGDRDRPRISPSQRAWFQTLLEGGMTWLDELATPASPTQHRQIRATFDDAAAELARLAAGDDQEL